MKTQKCILKTEKSILLGRNATISVPSLKISTTGNVFKFKNLYKYSLGNG